MCTHQDLFNNDKPWFSTKLKPLRQAKEDDYSSGEKALHKQAKYTLNEWRDKSGKEKLLCKAKKQRLYISVERPDSHHQLQDPTPSTEANQQLAEDLNEQKPGLTPYTHSDSLTKQPSIPYPLLFLSLY